MSPATVIKGLPVVLPSGIPKIAHLMQDVVVRVAGKVWTVKKGENPTDLASFPWFSRMVFSWTEAPYAAVWHDERYKKRDIPREEADLGFYRLAITGSEDGKVKPMPKIKAALAYAGLRANGHTWDDGGFHDN